MRNYGNEVAEYVAITKKAEYAILILMDLVLQSEDRYSTAQEIAERQRIPQTFTPQIISTLTRAGWIEGLRGPGGGVRPVVDLSDLSVLEVIETVDGPVIITRCLTEDAQMTCENRGSCPLCNLWAEAQEAMLKVLEDATIGQLAEKKQQLMLAKTVS
ncbi:MAG: Rrf2 family transcriptional regulator [Firmicutes bacterium]|nr:Rrf2 family transcriptional regulator [Bacillota bacterium]